MLSTADQRRLNEQRDALQKLADESLPGIRYALGHRRMEIARWCVPAERAALLVRLEVPKRYSRGRWDHLAAISYTHVFWCKRPPPWTMQEHPFFNLRLTVQEHADRFADKVRRYEAEEYRLSVTFPEFGKESPRESG